MPEFALSQPIPFRVWLGAVARAECEEPLRARLPSAELRVVPTDAIELDGPAILVLDAADLGGPDRQALLELARRALPGRPIVVGGGASKDILLDAINTWQAVQLVPSKAVAATLADAVSEAHQSLVVESGVRRCVDLLAEECSRLRSATEELYLTQKRLLHAERLATVGRIVGTVLERMRHEFDDLERFRQAQSQVPAVGPLGEIFEAAVAGVDGFGALLEDMLALSEERPAKTQRQVVGLDSLTERSVRLFKHDAQGRRRAIQVSCESTAAVHVDPCRMIHVLLNLLRNAAQATSANERITVRTRSEGDWAVVEVEDAGQGMTSEVLEHLFTPFFTTKGKEGMGLGLRLAKTTVDSHGGTIDCTSSPGHGARFRVRLPRAG
jgi:signal transduction histidine kinase